jgi:selenocysteine lyase/cysteine desulfurase
MHNKKITSIRIDPLLWKAIRKRAIDSGTSASKLTEEFLEVLVSPYLERGKPSFSYARYDFFWQDELLDLNSGALGSIPKQVIGKAIEYILELGKYGSTSRRMCERLEREEETCRANLASALNCEVDEVLFETNTTRSLRLALDILKILAKQSGVVKLLTTDIEHNSTKRLIKLGSMFEVHEIPLLSTITDGWDEERIIELFSSAINSHTRILLISHLPYLGGKLPVNKIIRVAKDCNNDIFCIVDGAHALGQMCIDLKKIDCDFYAVGVHKYCLGLPALGALYAKREYLERLASNSEKFPIFDNYAISKTFRTDEELGTINGIAIVAFNEAYNLLYQHYGIEKIQERIISLANYFIQTALEIQKNIKVVSPLSPDLITGAISFSIKNFSYDRCKKIVNQLESKHKILCKALQKPACIRICLHYFNSEEDIDRFFKALSEEI